VSVSLLLGYLHRRSANSGALSVFDLSLYLRGLYICCNDKSAHNDANHRYEPHKTSSLNNADMARYNTLTRGQ